MKNQQVQKIIIFFMLFLTISRIVGCASNNKKQEYFANKVTVQFQNKGYALKKEELEHDDSNIIGFVGDFVAFDSGYYKISLNIPNGYTLAFALKISEKEVSVQDTWAYPQNCKRELKVHWPTPKVRDSKHHKNVKVVTLEDPEFGPPTGKWTCVKHRMGGCAKRKIVLTAESEPSGAEIWIQGKKSRFLTNTTLSVPYCIVDPYPFMHVLLRKAGRVSCVSTVNPSPGHFKNRLDSHKPSRCLEIWIFNQRPCFATGCERSA